MKQSTPVKCEDDFFRCISYNTAMYCADFNTIMYNVLIEQAQHNEDVKMKYLDIKLEEVKAKALECYHKINT